MGAMNVKFDIEPPHLKYYDVFPLVVPAGRRSTIRIRPRYEHARFTGEVSVQIFPFEGERAGGVYGYGTLDNVEFHQEEDGTLVVTSDFPGEQQHDIAVTYVRPKNRWWPDRKFTRRFRVYSLHDDLKAVVPLKGDFHIHSNLSDGEGSPEYNAARYREEGFDFIAITDHFAYAPSLRARERCSRFDQDFKLFPGEEVHIGKNRVHVLNFGGSYSVNDLANSKPEIFEAEWKAIAKTLPDCPGNDPETEELRRHAAISEWAFREINKGGGLSMLCHYAWQVQGADVDYWTSKVLIDRHRFDLFELIGGYGHNEWRSNNLQIARYYDEVARGNRLVPIGVSDSHGTDDGVCFNWYYTIVLARDDSFEAIASAMRARRCCAIEAVEGSVPRVYGEERIVKYVSFLLENYFPKLKRLCAPEGALLKAALAGDETAAQALKALQGRVPSLREKCFPRG